MSLLEKVYALNRLYPNRSYYRFWVNKKPVGFIDTQIIDELNDSIFAINHKKQHVYLDFLEADRKAHEQQLEAFFKHFFAKQNINGWRNEYYDVKESFSSQSEMCVERAILSFLGITGYGVHVNGFFHDKNKIKMWIAKRSKNKSTAPGKLDQIAAGGLPSGLSVFDNVIKECQEEASIPYDIVKKSKPVSGLSYWYELDIGVRPDGLFCYDLELPKYFIPKTNDDEVDSFILMDLDDALHLIATSNQFKFNSAVVIIDFAIRHGVITPTDSNYLELQQGLHQKENSPHYIQFKNDKI